MRLLSIAIVLLLTTHAVADTKTKAAQEAAEYILQKFGKEAVKDGTSVLAQRMEKLAVTHGDEVFKAAKLVGPHAVELIEQAGAHGGQAAKVLATYGERGSVLVVARPKAMQLVAEHGEGAAGVIVKSGGAAEPVLAKFGKPAIGALETVSAQNARRLAMMTESGELAQIGRVEELLAVIKKFGNEAAEFIWREKGALSVGATLTAFLANPEVFLHAAEKVTTNAVAPIVKEGTQEVAKSTNWTLIFIIVIGVVAALAVARGWFPRPATRTNP